MAPIWLAQFSDPQLAVRISVGLPKRIETLQASRAGKAAI